MHETRPTDRADLPRGQHTAQTHTNMHTYYMHIYTHVEEYTVRIAYSNTPILSNWGWDYNEN